MKHMLMFALLGATAACASVDLQQLIDDAESGSTVTVPSGTYSQPITIKQGITLKGGPDSVLAVTANQPAVLIDSYKDVILEGLTIQWKLESTPGENDQPCAVLVRGGSATLQGCTFAAPGSAADSPGAAVARDKAEMTVRNCRFDGFDFPVQFWNGAEGRVEGCVVLHPGHCGITVGHQSRAVLTGNIVSGSGYHGIRCTGGMIEARSNLVVRNRNRGFYMGNRSVKGELVNNLIVENGIGINVYARSQLEIAHNVILRSSYAGLSISDSADLDIENNIIADNERGIIGFSDGDSDDLSVSVDGKNLLHGNNTPSEHIDLPSKTLTDDPRFKDPDDGLFAARDSDFGLSEPGTLQQLWEKWQAALDDR